MQTMMNYKPPLRENIAPELETILGGGKYQLVEQQKLMWCACMLEGWLVLS